METRKTVQTVEQSKAKEPAELTAEALEQVAGGIYSRPMPENDPVPVP